MSAAQLLEIESAVRDFRDSSKRKSTSGSNPVQSIRKAEEEIAENRSDVEFWRQARTAHFVGLYVWLHRQFYGVEPAELTQRKTAMIVLCNAKKFIEKEFSGDSLAYLRFVRWVFQGEKKSMAAGKNRDFVITWRCVFTATNWLTRYRMWRLKEGKQIEGVL